VASGSGAEIYQVASLNRMLSIVANCRFENIAKNNVNNSFFKSKFKQNIYFTC